MRGISVENRRGRTVVMTDEGDFVKLNQKIPVGDTVEIAETIHVSHLRRSILAACAALLICLGAGSIFAAVTPCSYVTLDVNPSLEYDVNYFNHVIDVKGLNSQGKIVAKELKDVKGDPVPSAIKKSIKVIKDKGYLGKNKSGSAIVSVVSRNGDKTAMISRQVVRNIKKDGPEKVTVDVVKGSIGDRKTAEKLKLSTGRLQVAKHLTGTSNRDIAGDPGKAKIVKKTGEKHVDNLVKAEDSSAARPKNTGGSGADGNGDSPGVIVKPETEAQPAQ